MADVDYLLPSAIVTKTDEACIRRSLRKERITSNRCMGRNLKEKGRTGHQLNR